MLPAAQSFEKHLSSHLSNGDGPAPRRDSVDNPAPAEENNKPQPTHHTDSKPPKSDAPEATEEKPVKEKPATKASSDKTNNSNSPAQDQKDAAPVPEDVLVNGPAATIPVPAQNTENAAAGATPLPADFMANLAALISGMEQAANPAGGASPAEAPAGETVSAAAKNSNSGNNSPDQSPASGKAAESAASLINGLPLGALGISAPQILQSLQQMLSSPENSTPAGGGAATLEIPPGLARALMVEVAKLSQNSSAEPAALSGPQVSEANTAAGLVKADNFPAPFADALAAAKVEILKKLQLAAQPGGTQVPSPASVAAVIPAAPAPLDAAKAAMAALQADKGQKPDAVSAPAPLLQNPEQGNAIVNGKSEAATASPAGLQVAEAAAKDALPPASGLPAVKTDVTLNPLPFATLGGFGPASLQIAPPLLPGAGNPLAAGQLYAAAHVAIEITRTVNEGGNQFSIRLDPAELGRVDVKLHFENDGRVTAAVSADNQNTLDLLRRDASLLDRALQDSGLKTDQGSLSFSLRQQGQQAGGQEAFTSDSNQRAPKAAPEAVDDLVNAAIASARSYVSNRALDITV